jgi:acid phosphatase type 7
MATLPSSPLTGDILLLAGDICKHNRGQEDYTENCAKTGDQVRQLLAANPGTQVQTLGDSVNNSFGLASYRSQYQELYDPNWGSFLSQTRVSMGNHDTYPPGGPSAYFDYFGAASGPTQLGYYSYEIGASWKVIVLNSQCWWARGCGPLSRQYRWLEQELSSNTRPCLMAVWHQPRFASGRHDDNFISASWWELLYRYHADLVINGHNHNYERFEPINWRGKADPAGIREIVSGTGGAPGDAYTYASHPLDPNQAVRNQSIVYGVLQLTLADGFYAWNFIPVEGYAFTDQGQAVCNAK